MPFKNPILVVDGDGGQYVEVTNDPLTNEPVIYWHTGAATEAAPGSIKSSGATQPSPLTLDITGPQHQDDANPPNISLSSFAGGESDINLFADRIATQHPIVYDTAWFNVTLLNSWAAVAGFSVDYRMDAAGNVHVRGAVAGGTAVTVGNLPAGYRPVGQLYEPAPLRATAGAGVVSSVQVLTNGNIVIVTNFASAQARLALDFSFPVPPS